MIINTDQMKSMSKVFGLIPSTPLDDFIYLDPSEKRIYISNRNTACYIDLDISDITSTDIPMVLSRSEFTHIISVGTTLELFSDYSYKNGEYAGKLEHNETLLDTLDSIKSMFVNDDFELSLSVDTTLLSKLEKAMVFVSQEDNNIASRGIHVHDRTISSSSQFRIYLDTIDSDADLFLPSHLLKLLFILGDNSAILKQNNMFKIQNQNITMIFTGLSDVAHLPVKEQRFIDSCNKIKSGSCVKLVVTDILPKIDFMMFFSKKKLNNLTQLELNDNKILISVDSNNTSYPCIANSDSNIKFNYDNLVLKDILTKIDKDATEVLLYCSDESKMVIVEFSEKQFVVFTKIII